MVPDFATLDYRVHAASNQALLLACDIILHVSATAKEGESLVHFDYMLDMVGHG